MKKPMEHAQCHHTIITERLYRKAEAGKLFQAGD